MTNVIELHPTPAIWKPSAAQLRAIRAYCARVERKRPMAIMIEVGERAGPKGHDANLLLVTDHPDWDDTDLHDFRQWETFKRWGVELTRDGRAVLDFYISERNYGGLLGNAQVHVETIDGRPVIVGFSATMHPFERVEPIA